MKTLTKFLVLSFIVVNSFSNHKSTAQTNENNSLTEFEQVVQYLETNGNFINTDAPAIILADEINKNSSNKDYLVLDLRSEGWFDYGYIENAINIKASELLNYFENKIDPSSFKKITLVCYSGQSAAYYTSLLRLYGYNNVYNLKWGISSWTDDYAGRYWGKNSKNTYADKLETTANILPEKGEFPILKTGKNTGEEILKVQIKEAFTKPYKEFIVKADSVFNNPSDFYIVNYVNEEIYNNGHITGSVRYQPKASLSSTTNLYTLPIDKKVLVSCSTGQSAAYAVAYLHILGYDVSNLAYGANSYMNATLIGKDWNGFSEKDVKNYPIIE